MLIPVLISILFIFIFLLLTDQIHKHSLLKNFIWILTMSLQAPLMLLFLAAFASNKVEGIALSKAFGILLMAVIIDYVFDSPLEWLGFFSPLFWLEKAYFTATSLQFYAYTGAAIILSSFTTAFLLKKFQNKQF
jgi:fluoroquinolone transport system permease protein